MAGNIPPAQHRHALRRGKLLKNPARVLRADFVFRKKEHPHTVVSGMAQEEAFFPCPRGEQIVVQLCQDSDPIAGGSE